jgi:putative glutamine amidotransferase
MRAEVSRPLTIGVTVRRGDSEWVEKSTRNYLNRLAEYGATAVILSPDMPVSLPDGASYRPDELGRLPDVVLDHLDGVIFSGGGDVDPRYFGQSLNGADPDSIDHLRDELEIHLGRAALERDLPVFGICRGCQVLNVAAGGGMVQHLDGHRSALDVPVLHEVRLQPGTLMHNVVGQGSISVNTYHHQGVDHATLAPTFVPAAVDQDAGWLIEAYESRAHRWVVGVQWHPERIFELPDAHRRLWNSFIEACKQ